MSTKIEKIDLLRTYLNGVFARTLCHAPNVNEVIFPLIGLVLLKSEGDIQVRDQEGDLKNVIWFNINGMKYSLKYDHALNVISLHIGSSTGQKIHDFQNSDSNRLLIEIFKKL